MAHPRKARIPAIGLLGLVTALSGGAAQATLIIRSGPNQKQGDGTVKLDNFALLGGGAFTGTVTEQLTRSRDIITYSGTFEGVNGSLTISNTYDFAGGPNGTLISDFSGTLMSSARPDLTTGKEFFRAQATATTYGGRKPVDAEWDVGKNFIGVPIPATGYVVTGQDSSMGAYAAGKGTLTGTISYSTDKENRTFVFPASGHFIAAVPEPSAIAMAGTAALTLLGYARRRRRSASGGRG